MYAKRVYVYKILIGDVETKKLKRPNKVGITMLETFTSINFMHRRRFGFCDYTKNKGNMTYFTTETQNTLSKRNHPSHIKHIK